MDYEATMAAINERRAQIMKLNGEIKALQADVEPEPVEDHTFDTPDGEVRLSELFGGKDTLYVVHNMGSQCVYCTQWADGFNGVLPHLEDRAAFVVSSPNSPAEQTEFAGSRGWNFRMVSLMDDDFATAMGFIQEYEGAPALWPGVSVFQQQGAAVVRVSSTVFGPGDSFNSAWHFFDMMPDAGGDWVPKLSYD